MIRYFEKKLYGITVFHILVAENYRKIYRYFQQLTMLRCDRAYANVASLYWWYSPLTVTYNGI